jgi:hypothetical protein
MLRDMWQSDRHARYGAILLKCIFPTIAVVLAMWIGWLFYPREPERWAEIEQLHLRWNQSAQKMHISMLFTKRVECNDILVSKHLVPILESGVVVGTNPIPLKGALSKQMLDVKPGTVELFDTATIEGNVKVLPGQRYWFTIVATCENDDTSSSLPIDALSTEVVRKSITAHSPPAPWTGLALAGWGVS